MGMAGITELPRNSLRLLVDGPAYVCPLALLLHFVVGATLRVGLMPYLRVSDMLDIEISTGKAGT